jgi:flagellar protein FlbD
VIVLHRLGHNAEPFHLNPDLIMTVEANPDTVVTLTTGTKIIVVESPVRVADQVHTWRSEILRDALGRRRDEALPVRRPVAGERPALSAIEGSPPAADHSER